MKGIREKERLIQALVYILEIVKSGHKLVESLLFPCNIKNKNTHVSHVKYK